MRSFNSRARKGRDFSNCTSLTIAPVSIHAPARGATPCSRQRFTMDCFNSRARKGRDRCSIIPTLVYTSFNSRARKGRDRRRDTRKIMAMVSIHAPARGATGQTTTKSAEDRFNSRARKGRDFQNFTFMATRNVSIHAPARGATCGPFCGHGRHEVFQFTRPQGARPYQT